MTDSMSYDPDSDEFKLNMTHLGEFEIKVDGNIVEAINYDDPESPSVSQCCRCKIEFAHPDLFYTLRWHKLISRCLCGFCLLRSLQDLHEKLLPAYLETYPQRRCKIPLAAEELKTREHFKLQNKEK